MCYPIQLSNEELNAIISGEQDHPLKGTILYLFPKNDSELVVASDSYSKLRAKGDEWVDIGWSPDGYSIVPLDREISGAYFL